MTFDFKAMCLSCGKSEAGEDGYCFVCDKPMVIIPLTRVIK